jgi:beta-glucanase (GH16 family)/Ca2+-binding RTX toxin-like protein
MSFLKYDGTRAVETIAPASNFFGTEGVDTLTGGAASEGFWGGQGDLMTGGGGDDTYYVKSAADRVIEQTGGGTDKIVAWTSVNLGNFANVENLEVGGDKTYGAGTSGDNIIQGGAGSQQLYGGGGQDVLIGGGGADTFIIVKGQGNDVIQDFTPSDGDTVRLTAGFTTFAQVQSHLAQVGSDVKLDLGGGDGLIFRNLNVSQLTASNFQLQLDTSKLGVETFHDDFNGALSLWDAESNPTGTWRPDFGYQGSQGAGSYTLASNGEQEIYTSPYFRDHNGDFPVNPFTSNADGTLSITAAPSTNSELFGQNYTSGMISTAPSFAQTYGYFEMRAELPSTAGAWPAFWLIPADGSWPPELDVMETLGGDPNTDYTTQHSAVGGANVAVGSANFIPGTTSGYHTYGVLWTSSTLNWYVDGVEVFHTATPADMNKPMYMIANLALGGWSGAIDNANLPATMKIDYVHAYALADGSSTTVDSPTSGLAATATGSAPPPATTPPTTTPPGPTTPPGSPPTIDPSGATAGAHLTSVMAGDTLTGGAGADTLTASQGADRLSGGAGADLFEFKALPWRAGHITDFHVGVDKIDISSLYLGGYHGTDPLADGYVTFVSDGAGGTKVMLDIDGHAAANPWSYTIVILDGVSPVGLTAGKVLGTGTASSTTGTGSTPNGGGVVLTSAFAGDRLTGGAGGDTLNASQGADRLTGGAGGDTFVFKNLPWSAGHITDFQVGADRLDLSAFIQQSHYTGTDPIADGYLILRADGVGGAQVLWDTDGPATGNPWPITITTLDNVRPGDLTASVLLSPSGALAPAGVVLTSTEYGSTLAGGAGKDTLNAGQGPDVMTGGAGADHFVFAATPWNSGHITDFTPGSDVLDLRGIFSEAHYSGTDPLADGHLSFQSDGNGGTKIYVDVDGASGKQWPFLITTLDHVAPGAINVNDWLFH